MDQNFSNEKSEIMIGNSQDILSALATHQIMMWEYHITTGQCKFADGYFRILGLEDVGIAFDSMESFFQCAQPEDIDTYQTTFNKVLKGHVSNQQVRVRCVGANGEVIYLEDHFLALQSDKEGCLDKLLACTINVTQQYEKEAKIRLLEERNRKIIEALPEFIFIIDDHFFIRDVLMAQNTVLLHPIEALKGVDGRTIYSPEVSELFVFSIRECLQDGELKEIEYHLDLENVRYYFQARIAPFDDNKVLALIHDIGERVRRDEELIRAKQRAEEADRMKTLFLANMSHEIRTPLNAIVGFAEIIAFTEDEEEKREYLSIIQQNSNLLLQLINDILDLSRIEAGRSEMQVQMMDVSSLIDEVEKVHQLKMNAGVDLKVIRPSQQIWISTDRNRVTQILSNFMSNSIKNTEKGSITLELKADQKSVTIAVTDTGCGIPADRLPFIFERFEKLNEFKQGTGLGLPICQSIAERLGGCIDVVSEVGVGSTFSLCLPFVKMPSKKMNEDQSNEIGVSTRKKILVVEDIESSYSQINITLNKDYTILWARNGQEAIDSFLREKPDLILMDVRMPVMNGIEATEKIRAISAQVPIIAVTAHAFYTEQQQALQAGCNGILSKPYTLQRLKETINAYL